MFWQIVMSLGLFLGLLAGLEVGRWLRLRRAEPETANDFGAVEAVVFTILGLVIAFTFSNFASRFDERRQLIVEQADVLQTAWRRIDMLPEPDREPVRRCMREWVRVSLDATRSVKRDAVVSKEHLDELQNLQNEAWRMAAEAVDRHQKPQYATFVLTPINTWTELTSKRMAMSTRDLPWFVVVALVVLSLASAILAGFSLAKRPARSLTHMLLFAGVLAFLIYVITDIGHPRAGFIRVDSTDDAMLRLYATMTSEAPPPTTRPDHP